jgi:adenylate cyclase
MMAAFNDELSARDLPRLRLRAGVTTGEVIAGDAGSRERSDYTVLGTLVNLAARLESANKSFGTSNLVTEPTVQQAGDRFLFRPIGIVRVVGLQTGVMVYEVMAWAADATPAQKEIAAVTTELVGAFAAGCPAECLAVADRLDALCGASKLTRIYRDRCEPYASGDAAGDMPREIVLAEK